jgi:hypothetical protein
MLMNILKASNLFVELAVDFYNSHRDESCGGAEVVNCERMNIAAKVAAQWAVNSGGTPSISQADLIEACKQAGWDITP